jgi:ketosteroid isomerase-like protein
MSREAVDAGHAAFLAAMKVNDAEALGRTVAENALFMPPHEPVVSGKQGIVAWMDAVNKQARTTEVTVSGREVIVAGDVATERGSFVWKLQAANGAAIEDRGNFLAIWQKQSDGSWKVASNIWNSTLPPKGN